MGNLKYPQIEMYWKAQYRVNQIAENIGKNRFFTLRSNLKFVVDEQISDDIKKNNRLWRVQSIIDLFRTVCLSFPRDKNCSIDEQMIPFYGKTSLRQYIPNKPNPVGLKNFVLANPKGLILDFEIYQGATTLPENMRCHGLAAGIVLRLSQTLPPGSCLYFDRFFNSTKLLDLLCEMQINATGTVMRNRFGRETVPLKPEKEMKKKGRGSSVAFVREDRKLAITEWFDTRIVTLGSNCRAVEEETIVERWDKKQRKQITISCPRSVADYNKYMGGVDMADRMISYYRFAYRTRKWTVRFLHHFIDAACSNAFIEMQAHEENSRPSLNKLILYRFHVAEHLLCRPKPEQYVEENDDCEVASAGDFKKRRPLPPERVRGAIHLPEYHDLKNAKRCRLPGCSMKTRWWCVECKVFLCLVGDRNCFSCFHQ
jgi:hypothetical protein